MNEEQLHKTAVAMVAPEHGILAADESAGTIEKRFKSIGVESTEERRRSYRGMLFSAVGAEQYIGGVILFEETLFQAADDGTPFPRLLTGKGIIPGIKVDKGAKALAGAPGERITEGLDGLRERLAGYREAGARFAKWRAVITVGEGIPSGYCIHANAHALARYAALCQEADLVPIVEPEVLMDGQHDIGACEVATSQTLEAVFHELYLQRVALEGMILKPNMVVSGNKCPVQADCATVAAATLRTLKRHVPPAVPGVAFLSGGQSDEQATTHLDAMNRIGGAPWRLSFSYGRALQHAALQAWAGCSENAEAVQRAFLHRARMNSLATAGRWQPTQEKAG